MIILNDEFMTSKILFWFGTNYTHFCLSHNLQKKIDAEMYAIVDVTEKPKPFFQNQKLVNFEKIWFFHDHIKQKNQEPDMEYLEKFEKKYKIDLWKLVQNERVFLYYNFHKFSKNEILNILEQECRFFENILDEIKPDFFFSKIPSLHHHELFYEMCKNSGVHVQIINFSMLGQKSTITQEHENFDQTDDLQNLENKNRTFLELQEYYKSSNLLNNLVDNLVKPGKTKSELFESTKEYLLNSDSKNTQTHYTYYGRKKIKVLFYYIKDKIRTKNRKKFIDKNLKNDLILPKKFIFFPLHTEIERTLLITAPFYLNQIEIIKNIAKSIPINYTLIVKEHPFQTARGWRSIDDYNEIMNIPNVELVHPTFPNEKLYQNCSLLITIAGTGGFEVTFYGKPVITFVNLNYSILPSVTTLTNFHELPKIIRDSLQKTVHPSDLDRFISLLEKNSSNFNYGNFTAKFNKEFFYGGRLVDTEISESKIKSFIEENESILNNLADEHISKMNFFKK
ncbi:MAG: hypothetical protein CL763_08405 [Chloroflexi bacterium]|nr:hypothetical protein [Chloroflexota bacterium]|tara:strand:- start:4320 stop:5843 length:1524 start_codon:yes stop_codon:yes gene_type:complete